MHCSISKSFPTSRICIRRWLWLDTIRYRPSTSSSKILFLWRHLVCCTLARIQGTRTSHLDPSIAPPSVSEQVVRMCLPRIFERIISNSLIITSNHCRHFIDMQSSSMKQELYWILLFIHHRNFDAERSCNFLPFWLLFNLR